jgi:uncharacterized protein YraI
MIGKSIYIWNILADPELTAKAVKAAGFQTAILHEVSVAAWKTPARLALVQALRAVGVESIGGAAVYGANPEREGQQAAQICEAFGLKAFVFDAESKFDAQPDSAANAVKLLKAFKAGTKAKSVWCWWAMYQPPSGSGSWHPVAVLKAAMEHCDYGMPMAYWSWGNSPADAVRYLNESWKQWRLVTDKPIFPAGRAYSGDGGAVNPEACRAFDAKARELGAEGVTWWVMERAINADRHPGLWAELCGMAAYDGKQAVPVPVTPALKRYAVCDWVTLGLNFRKEPNYFGTKIATLRAGETLIETGAKTGEWLQVTYNSQTGWVHKDYIKAVGAAGEPKRYAVCKQVTMGLNFRDKPNMSGARLALLKAGSVLTGTGARSGEWIQAVHAGKTGWVYGEYVERV